MREFHEEKDDAGLSAEIAFSVAVIAFLAGLVVGIACAVMALGGL